MISFFLDPYPEEIIYSTVARNASALNYPNLRSVGATYFGNPQTIATVAFPCRLEYMVTHLPWEMVHTVDTLIDEHTLLPFFSPFLLPSRVTQLRDNMCHTQGMSVHMRAGVMASTVPTPDALRFCPICAKEDKERHGESFWHRQHQVSGVYVCSKHHIWLEASSVQLANRQTRHTYITAENAITYLPSSQPILKTQRETVLLTIAQSVQWLLEQKPVPQGLEHLQERYVRALVKRDLATFSGRVRITEVMEAFTAFYPKEILAFLHCELDTQSQDNWLARLVRKPDSALHPIHHFLLINFLDGSLADYLLDSPKPQAPFGNGPWPCLNPVCSQYKACVIKICTITYPLGLNGRPSGTFSCTCSFIYGRVGPDKDRDDIYRRGKIISVGEVWENTLRKHWATGTFSLRGTAKLLGVDPLTVKRYVQRLGLVEPLTKKNQEELIFPQAKINSEHLVETTCTPLNSMRVAWQEVCNTYGHCGRKAVRQQIPRVYTWLYRHDKDWLEQHLPLRKSLIPSQRIDWTARDIEISRSIPKAIQNLQMQPGPPRRITTAAIGRSIGYLAMIQQHLNRLPLTAAVLMKAEESRATFAIRRIQWVSAHLYRQGRLPKRWELIRLCGVERLLSEEIVQKSLEEAINKSNIN